MAKGSFCGKAHIVFEKPKSAYLLQEFFLLFRVWSDNFWL